MYKYSKLVVTGIAGIAGGIYLDRSFLNDFKDANDIENARVNGTDDIGTLSAQTLKVFICSTNILSYETI